MDHLLSSDAPILNLNLGRVKKKSGENEAKTIENAFMGRESRRTENGQIENGILHSEVPGCMLPAGARLWSAAACCRFCLSQLAGWP
jgi:hypothetical protein